MNPPDSTCCSFCGRLMAQVKRLVYGQASPKHKEPAYICNLCIDQFTRELREAGLLSARALKKYEARKRWEQ